MDVETADLAKRSFSFRDVVFLRVKFPDGERRLDVPPIIAGKFLDGQQGGIGTLRFAQQFGFETDQAPDARIIATGFDENLESAGGVVSLDPHLGHIEDGDPSAGIFLARFGGRGAGFTKGAVRFVDLSLAIKSIGQVIAGHQIRGA